MTQGTPVWWHTIVGSFAPLYCFFTTQGTPMVAHDCWVLCATLLFLYDTRDPVWWRKIVGSLAPLHCYFMTQGTPYGGTRLLGPLRHFTVSLRHTGPRMVAQDCGVPCATSLLLYDTRDPVWWHTIVEVP